MPVIDLNGQKMGTDMATIFETTSDISGFWVANGSFIAWILIVAVLLGCFLFVFFFLKGLAKKMF